LVWTDLVLVGKGTIILEIAEVWQGKRIEDF